MTKHGISKFRCDNSADSIWPIVQGIFRLLRLNVQILNRVGLTKVGALISFLIFILGSIFSVVFFVLQELVGGLLTVFLTVLGLFLTLLFSRISSHLGIAKKSLRTLEKGLRDMRRQLSIITGDTSATYLSVSDSEIDFVGRGEYDELKKILEEKTELENQVLRQIVAESRLIRISMKQANDNTGE